MIDQNDKIIISQTRTEQLRSEIEAKEQIKIKADTALCLFVIDLIRMAAFVKDPAIKRIFLHPYEEAKAGEPEWHQATRNTIQKVIKLSKESQSYLNTFPFEELHSKINKIIAECSKNPGHKKNANRKEARSFDMWSLAANDASEELEKVKTFLEKYVKPSKRLAK